MASSDAAPAASTGSTESPWTFLVPGDPEQRTGGYIYVREVVRGLEQLGQAVELLGLEGRFPEPDDQARAAMDQALSRLPAGAVVILDGLAMGGLPEVLAWHRQRLRLIALVHHPLADEAGLAPEVRDRLFAQEREALAQVAGVLTTSATTAAGLARYRVLPDHVRVVTPGVHKPPSLPERPAGKGGSLRLLCVATLSERKAQHQLVEALAQVPGGNWHCVLAGSDERQPEYAARLRRQIKEAGLEERIRLSGELGEEALARQWQEADLMVLPSLYEGYGMVVDEALVNGLPVLTSDGGALAETGRRPGVLQYPAGDVAALRQRLEEILAEPERLPELQSRARETAAGLQDWAAAAAAFRQAVTGLLAQAPAPASQFRDDWLSLREPADHAGRSADLARQASHWLQSRPLADAPQVVDLGCGTGSNLRYLAPLLPADTCWLLVDQDPALLARARQSAPGLSSSVQVDYLQTRLRPDNLAQALPTEPDLVTASALLDLVSEPWLAALADYVAGARAGLLVALSYSGKFGFADSDPDDQWLLDLINAHQQGDKGAGRALGPAATGVLARHMAGRGYQVREAASPWRLGPEHQTLQSALLAGWRDAALDQEPDSRERILAWAERRQGQIQRGESQIVVQHQDLLALPPEPAAQ